MNDYWDEWIDITESEPEEEEIGDDPESPVYHLKTDDDGHWYVISDNDDNDFIHWVKDMNDGVESEFDFSDCRVNNPYEVYFRDFWVIDK